MRKPTYKELEQEVYLYQNDNKLIDNSSLIKILWKNEATWPIEKISGKLEPVLGYTSDELLGNNFNYSKIIHHKDIKSVNSELKKNIKNGSNSFEQKSYRIISKNGEIKWLKVFLLLIRDKKGFVTHFQGLVMDITIQKDLLHGFIRQNKEYLTLNEEYKTINDKLIASQNELIKSERKYRLLAENVSDVIWVFNFTKNKFVYISPSVLQVRGYTVEEAMELSFTDSLTEGSKKHISKVTPLRLAEFKQGIHSVYRDELEQKSRNNKLIWVEMLTSFRYAEDGSVEIHGISRNTTDRKLMELELKKQNTEYLSLNEEYKTLNINLLNSQNKAKRSEQRFRNFFKYNTAIMLQVNPLTKQIIDVNLSALNFYKYTKAELLRKTINDLLVIPKEQINNKISEIINKDSSLHELKHRLSNGDIRDVEVRVSPIKEGEEILMFAIINDITDRKKNESAIIEKNKELKQAYRQLEDSNAKYKQLSNLTFEGILIHKNGIAIDVNMSFSKIFGYTKEEIIGQNVIDFAISKKSKKLMLENISKNYSEPYEVEGVTKNGKKLSIELESKYINTKSNLRVVAVRNISERKKAKQEIKKLSMAIEQSGNTIVITDIKGNIEYTNPKFTELTGYSAEEALGRNPRFLRSNSAPIFDNQEMWNTITAGKTWRGEFENITKNGIVFFENATITPVVNEEGEIINYISIKEDITQKKLIEKALLESEKRFKFLSDATFEAIFILQNGRIIDVNQSALEMTQYTYDEIVGKNLFTFSKTGSLKALLEQISNNKSIEDIGIKKDGSLINIEVQGKIHVIDKRSFIIVAVRDITEQKRTLKALETAQNDLLSKVLEAEEKERSRIASDLHDGIGPDLSSIKLHLNALENAKSKKETDIILNSSYKIIKDSIYNLKQISKNLSPYILKDFGVEAALNDFVNSVRIGNIDINYESNIEKLRFKSEVEISVFRITKELINNSIKYSNAEHIYINLTYKNQKLLFIYNDDGVGFDVNEKLNINTKESHFGLKNITSRIKSLNGNIDIKSNNEHGILVKIDIFTKNI